MAKGDGSGNPTLLIYMRIKHQFMLSSVLLSVFSGAVTTDAHPKAIIPGDKDCVKGARC
jgi:hypothetical protein